MGRGWGNRCWDGSTGSLGQRIWGIWTLEQERGGLEGMWIMGCRSSQGQLLLGPFSPWPTQGSPKLGLLQLLCNADGVGSPA